MEFFIIIEMAAILFFFLSYHILKGNSFLIHEYYRKNVEDEDKKSSYSAFYSKALLSVAIGFFIAGIFKLFTMDIGLYISLITGIIIALLFINKARKIYILDGGNNE